MQVAADAEADRSMEVVIAEGAGEIAGHEGQCGLHFARGRKVNTVYGPDGSSRKAMHGALRTVRRVELGSVPPRTEPREEHRDAAADGIAGFQRRFWR